MHGVQKQLQVEKTDYAEIVAGVDENKLVYLVTSEEHLQSFIYAQTRL